MKNTNPGLAKWHDYMEHNEGTAEGLKQVLHPDCVFHSPVVHTPQRGRPIVTAYLVAAANTLGKGNFKYVRELADGNHALLEFTTEMDGIHVNGIDLITFDDNGMIIDFKVMIRPLKAVNKVWEQMASMLERQQAG